jgi:acid phosphatase type 7
MALRHCLLIFTYLMMDCANSLASAQKEATKTRPGEAAAARGPFVAKPYLQMGQAPTAGKLVLMWHAADVDGNWGVEYQVGTATRWQGTSTPTSRRIAVLGVEPHRIYHAALTGLQPGEMFGYRVMLENQVVFTAETRAPKLADQPQRFVVFGDCGAGTPEEKAIAYRAYLSRPDFIMITGDIVYGDGRITEYREKYWPIMNADEASPSQGAPLLRSTLTMAAPGNHDIAHRDLGKMPDGLAYFYYWNQPVNGPAGKEGGPLVAPVPGPESNKKAFLEAAGDAFPRMANFSFDYGSAHWTVLDANPTVDWSNPEVQAWVAADLAAAKAAAWRFVSFHQPGFNSSKTHFNEQQMRILAPVFEAGRVDVVFSGHVHNYQRSYPLRFRPAAASSSGTETKSRRVDGQWMLDKKFNGQTDTTPQGVIYVITGAGGQHLYNPEQQDDPASWQEFTFKHVSKVHSLTVADIDGTTLTIRQLTPAGDEVDRFVIAK